VIVGASSCTISPKSSSAGLDSVRGALMNDLRLDRATAVEVPNGAFIDTRSRLEMGVGVFISETAGRTSGWTCSDHSKTRLAGPDDNLDGNHRPVSKISRAVYFWKVVSPLV
jgi:hypothetical protein